MSFMIWCLSSLSEKNEEIYDELCMFISLIILMLFVPKEILELEKLFA